MRRFAAPALIALWIVGSAPFLGRLTRWIQEEVDRTLLVVVPTVLFWVAVAAFGVRVVRSWRRLRWWPNYAALLVGVLWALVQATALARGRPEESALERMHLVLYGLVALLLYRAFLRGEAGLRRVAAAARPGAGDRPPGGPGQATRDGDGGIRTREPLARSTVPALVAAFFAAALTSLLGIADEFVQWLVWVRAGDFYDCLLNASAAGCGVVFGVGLFGFEALAGGRSAGAQRGTLALSAGDLRTMAGLWVILAAASFGLVELTNLGHRIVDPELGSFRSYYNAERLERLNENRRRRWAAKPPPQVLQPWHVEDHFLSEAAWHVQARNEAFDAEDWPTAAAEEAILNRYYPAVVELRNLDGHLRYAFPAERVQRLREAGAVLAPTYESPAGGNRIWIWPAFLAPALFLLALVPAAVPFLARRRRPPRST